MVESNPGIDYWEFLAGLALFLFAMGLLESALKSMGGRTLAQFLKQQSENRFKAVLGGLLGTALLQSSSVVGLMVLAFVGAPGPLPAHRAFQVPRSFQSILVPPLIIDPAHANGLPVYFFISSNIAGTTTRPVRRVCWHRFSVIRH